MIGRMISEARSAKGWSQAELAKKIGTSQQQIARYENEAQDMKSSMLLKMSAALGVTVSYLLGMEADSSVGKAPFLPVPLYGSVAAGTPMEMVEAEEMKEAPARFVIADPDAYLVRVRGSSMNRIIHDGSYALVSPHETAVNDRDMFLVTVNGDDATIKRVHRLENGVELVPDSYDPTFRPRVFDFGEEGTPAVRVLGKIVWWCAEF